MGISYFLKFIKVEKVGIYLSLVVLIAGGILYFLIFTKPYEVTFKLVNSKQVNKIPKGMSVQPGWAFGDVLVIRNSSCQSHMPAGTFYSTPIGEVKHDFCVEDLPDGRHYYMDSSVQKLIKKDQAIEQMDHAVTDVISKHSNMKTSESVNKSTYNEEGRR